MSTTVSSTTRLIGTVTRVVVKEKQGHSFFFIESGGERYFASINDVKTLTLPERGALVRFDPLPVFTEGKCDRALNIEIVSAPG